MAYNSMTLLQFQRRFATEAACWTALRRHRWPGGFLCPQCHWTQGWWSPGKRVYECTHCHRQTSPTAGTIFHKTRVPLRKWFWMLFLLSQQKHGMAMRAFQQLLGLGAYETAWRMAHKIRKAMADRDAQYPLRGLLEMDEGFFGGRKNKRPHAPRRTPVWVAVERRGNGCRFAAMAVLPARTRAAIAAVVAPKVQLPATFRTDGAYQYAWVGRHRWYGHAPRKVCAAQYAAQELPWVHTLIANTKRFVLGTHHGVSRKHLHRYLAEYCYRFNRRFWEPQLFDRLLTAAANARPITFQELTG